MIIEEVGLALVVGIMYIYIGEVYPHALLKVAN
jgi:hypothetical protein